MYFLVLIKREDIHWKKSPTFGHCPNKRKPPACEDLKKTQDSTMLYWNVFLQIFLSFFFSSGSLFSVLAKSTLRMSIQSPCKQQWVNFIYLWRVDSWQLLCVVKKCFTCWQLHLNFHFYLCVWFHRSLFWVPILAAKVPYFIKSWVPISKLGGPHFRTNWFIF